MRCGKRKKKQEALDLRSPNDASKKPRRKEEEGIAPLVRKLRKERENRDWRNRRSAKQKENRGRGSREKGGGGATSLDREKKRISSLAANKIENRKKGDSQVGKNALGKEGGKGKKGKKKACALLSFRPYPEDREGGGREGRRSRAPGFARHCVANESHMISGP